MECILASTRLGFQYRCYSGYPVELASDSCMLETIGRTNCGTWFSMKASSFVQQALFGRCSKCIPGFRVPSSVDTEISFQCLRGSLLSAALESLFLLLHRSNERYCHGQRI